MWILLDSNYCIIGEFEKDIFPIPKIGEVVDI